MFNKLKDAFKMQKPAFDFPAPLSGEVIDITAVNDPTFSEKMLGNGVAIKPSGGKILSPVDGKIALMFETGHAVSIISDAGMEILIHVGLDTIMLHGKYYKLHKKTDDIVKKGDLLIEFDKNGIASEGFDTVTPVIITNSEDYETLQTNVATAVNEMETVMKITGPKALREK